MRLSEKQSDFMWMLVDLLNYSKKLFKENHHEKEYLRGIYLKIQQLNRTVKEQRLNVERGVAWTMKSYHLNGLAVDFQIMRAGKPLYGNPVYRIMGNYWISIGGRWGGEWKGKKHDPVHFEYNLKRRKEYLNETK